MHRLVLLSLLLVVGFTALVGGLGAGEPHTLLDDRVATNVMYQVPRPSDDRLGTFWEDVRRLMLFYVLPITIPFMIAYGVHLLAKPIARRLVPVGSIALRRRTDSQRQQRHQTVVSLVAGLTTTLALFIAFLAALAPIVGIDSLVWMIGLFAAGFGFSAKPFIGDYMTGVMFILEDDFTIGEKVEIVGIEGVVETITLRTTTLRGMNGEAYTIPNGEIRSVRNFSRGRYTPVKVSVRVPSKQLRQAVLLLENLGEEAMLELPNMLEPWRVITEDGTMGQHTDLTLVAKATFGKGAEMRPRVLALVQERLESEGVLLAD